MDYKKEDDIKVLVKLIDPAGKNVVLVKELFMDVTKVKKDEWSHLLEEIDFNIVASLYYPIYDKYFTHNEIKELIKFYSSPAGVKFVQSKGNSYRQIILTQDELNQIDQFKKTGVGEKYNKLINKISHQHTKLVKKYIESLR